MLNDIRRKLAIASSLIVLSGLAFAQVSETYTARLSWVPISGAQRSQVSGQGAATATISGSQLSISGSFGDLPGAATLVSLRQGVATGARGPAVAELQVTQASDGTFFGEVELDDEQLAALLAGHLYIQLHAQGGVPPDNAVLRGWLLQIQ